MTVCSISCACACTAMGRQDEDANYLRRTHRAAIRCASVWRRDCALHTTASASCFEFRNTADAALRLASILWFSQKTLARMQDGVFAHHS